MINNSTNPDQPSGFVNNDENDAVNDASGVPTVRPIPSGDFSQGHPDPNGMMSASLQPPPQVGGTPAMPVLAKQPQQNPVKPHDLQQSIFRSVLEGFSGGPVKRVNPQTGEVEIQHRGKASIASGILAGAISGMLAGAAARPNVIDLGNGRTVVDRTGSLAAGAQGAQQQMGKLQQMSDEDQARAYTTWDMNLKKHVAVMNAERLQGDVMRYGMENDAAALKAVTDENEINGGLIKNSHISSQKMQEMLQSGELQGHKDAVLIDGMEPTGDTNPDGTKHMEYTYTIVDPNAMVKMSDQIRAEHPELGKVGDGTSLPLRMIMDYSGKKQRVQAAQGVIDNLVNRTNAAFPETKMNPVDLKQALGQSPALRGVLDLLPAYGNLDPDQVIDGLRKSKADPVAIAALERVIGNPNDAAWSAKRKVKDSQAKIEDEMQGLIAGPIKDDNMAQSIKSSTDPRITSARKTEADSYLQGGQNRKRDLKKAELNDQRAIQDSDINRAARTLVDDPTNIASIKNMASMRGDERLRLFNAATDYAASQGKKFDAASADRKTKMLDQFENGKQADQIQSYQTFLKHDADLYKALNSFSRPGYTPKWVNQPLNWLEKNAASDPEIGAYLAKLTPVRDEIQTFLKNNHAPLQQDVDDMEKVLDPGQSPAYLMKVAQSLATTGNYRLDSLNSRYKHEFKQDYDGLYDQESIQALRDLDSDGKAGIRDWAKRYTLGNTQGTARPNIDANTIQVKSCYRSANRLDWFILG